MSAPASSNLLHVSCLFCGFPGIAAGSAHWHASNEGEFNMPWEITVDHAADVYVADWRNDRIQKFDPDGRFIAGFGCPGRGKEQFHWPSGVAVDREGYIYAYAADWGNERVQHLEPDGQFIAEFRGEAGWSKLARDWFNIANQDLLEEWPVLCD
jgi:hypothetical protein